VENDKAVLKRRILGIVREVSAKKTVLTTEIAEYTEVL
jgi:hypothetical protein